MWEDSDDPPPPGGSAEWVGSGSFRVDRRKALEKLSEYGLPDPDDFLLPLARAAVATGAQRLHLRQTPEGVELRFDGRPFSAAELKNPYGYFLEGDATPAQRHLGMGLLSALRIPSVSVEIDSGIGPERLRLRVESIETEGVSPLEEAEEATVLHVRRGDRRGLERALGRVSDSCAMSPAQVWVNGMRIAPLSPEEREPEVCLTEEGTRLCLRVPPLTPGASSGASDIELYVFGVRVDKGIQSPLRTQVHALVNDDRLRLNASDSAVVEDERLRRCLHLLKNGCRELIPVAAQALRLRLPEVWRRLTLVPKLQTSWGERIEGRARDSERPDEPGSSILGAFKTPLFLRERPLLDLERESLAWELRAMSWLRKLCWRRFPDLTRVVDGRILRELWSSPVYLSCGGTSLSLADIDELQRRQGRVPYSTARDPRQVVCVEPKRVIWIVSKKELGPLAQRYTLEDVR